MGADALLIAGGAAALGGVAILRRAWALPRRSWRWNAAGWALLATAAILGWAGAGAWGAAIAALAAMGLALILLGHAAATAPASGGKASNRAVGALPRPGESWRLGRRALTFGLTVFAAMIVALGIGCAFCMALAGLGVAEGDALVTGFYAVPLAWALLVHLILMEERRARQWRLLAICTIPGALAALAAVSR